MSIFSKEDEKIAEVFKAGASEPAMDCKKALVWRAAGGNFCSRIARRFFHCEPTFKRAEESRCHRVSQTRPTRLLQSRVPLHTLAYRANGIQGQAF